MRIYKFLSDSGVASRRDAAKVARSGGLLVDGVAVKDTSKHIDPDKNEVSFLGKIIRYSRRPYSLSVSTFQRRWQAMEKGQPSCLRLRW